MKISIEAHSVHLWRTYVPDLLAEMPHFFALLNPIELARAKRFRFIEHCDRYVIARGVLRSILHLYTGIPATDMEFILNKHGKPYLKDNVLNLQFNVSHSHDWVVYAVTMQKEVGIDIEKIKPQFDEAVAKRFFSLPEYIALMTLPEIERTTAFYRIWSGKEAVIKVLGEGLYASTTAFALDINQEAQQVVLMYQNQIREYFLHYFLTHENYQSAVATEEEVKEWVHWEWTAAGGVKTIFS